MYFFFYGTLLDGSDNVVARSIHAKLTRLGQATATGSLYGVPDPEGWFPALLPGTGTVDGGLYLAGPGFGESDLARMDAYEDCEPLAPEASLYRREPMPVLGSHGRVEAQVYLFNRPLPAGSRVIPGGNFRRWVAVEELPVFGGTRSG